MIFQINGIRLRFESQKGNNKVGGVVSAKNTHITISLGSLILKHVCEEGFLHRSFVQRRDVS